MQTANLGVEWRTTYLNQSCKHHFHGSSHQITVSYSRRKRGCSNSSRIRSRLIIFLIIYSVGVADGFREGLSSRLDDPERVGDGVGDDGGREPDEGVPGVTLQRRRRDSNFFLKSKTSIISNF